MKQKIVLVMATIGLVFAALIVVSSLSQSSYIGRIHFQVWDENSWEEISGKVWMYGEKGNLLETISVTYGEGFSRDKYTFGDKFLFRFDFPLYQENLALRKLGVWEVESKVNLLQQFLKKENLDLNFAWYRVEMSDNEESIFVRVKK